MISGFNILIPDSSYQHSSDQYLGEPARSTGPAILVGGWAIEQLWLFWLAPIVGAASAGFVYRALLEGAVVEPPVTGRRE